MRAEKSDAAYLQDMLDAGEAVMRYVSGKTREDFDGNDILRDAVERRVEIFGEAARGVSQPFQNAHPEISWRKIKGTRHILAHDYGEVDQDIMWRIATAHVPETLVYLRKLVPAPPQDGRQ
jgi:uncharacterized protein with HEPN domain